MTYLRNDRGGYQSYCFFLLLSPSTKESGLAFLFPFFASGSLCILLLDSVSVASSRGRLFCNCQFFPERGAGLWLLLRDSLGSTLYEKSRPSAEAPTLILELFGSSSDKINLLNWVEIFFSMYRRRGRAPYNGLNDSFKAKLMAGSVISMSMLRSLRRSARSRIWSFTIELRIRTHPSWQHTSDLLWIEGWTSRYRPSD